MAGLISADLATPAWEGPLLFSIPFYPRNWARERQAGFWHLTLQPDAAGFWCQV